MTSHQLDEERIFHIARQIPVEAARSEYLDQICAGDQQLRDRVEALLEVHENEQAFLKSDPDAAPTVDHKPLTEHPGTTIGRYKLMEQIGEGGMGTVFVAEQERPIRRKVALKVIKPGMDSKAVVARFEAERQALALMDHPNIAKVLDAGTTDSGRPYFVMELVRGIPITEYCDQHKLTIRERLELFTQVCQAIQHAHQKAIIHRDIKPTNVLVTEQDGKPVPKVIDFGVAKALNQRLTDRTIYTSFAQVVGTPLYMSPEQAALSAVDVDTRSDVYSLGVLLYELLTGTTPFDRERFEQAAYDEIRRIVREEEPPKPSTKISTLGGQGVSVAQNRRTDHDKLGRAVRGDLDWIALKALEKDRGRRYETTSALATDVGRYLSSEPVEARPPSTLYRLDRFVRRNRATVATASLLTVVVLVASVVSALGWLRASQRLAAMRELVVDQAMLQAIDGELESLESTIEHAKSIGVTEDWLHTLHGIYHVHQGDYATAVEYLQEARLVNNGNVSAQALLSHAYYLNGDFENWAIQFDSLEDATPRPDYKDYDELFLAYAWFYTSFEETAAKLTAVLKRHPTWFVPRVVLASAWRHVALVSDNREAAAKALAEVQAPKQLAGDNPFVLGHCLGVYETASKVLGEDDPERNRIADELADKLSRHPDYAVGNLLRAVRYERLKQKDKALMAWRDQLDHGNGVLASWAAAELFRIGDSESVLSADRNGTEFEIAKAYIRAFSTDPGAQQLAIESFERLAPDCKSWVVRNQLIQIPLLLGDRPRAERQCKDWIAKAAGHEGFDDDKRFDKESIEYLARKLPEHKFDTESDDPIERFYANYQQAFLELAAGHSTEAANRFGKCEKVFGAYHLECWARAFHSRLSHGSAVVTGQN